MVTAILAMLKKFRLIDWLIGEVCQLYRPLYFRLEEKDNTMGLVDMSVIDSDFWPFIYISDDKMDGLFQHTCEVFLLYLEVN